MRLIRQGGQGSVYLGYDGQLRRRVAVKLYRLPGERRVRREVLAEARTIAAIDSPRVVKVYDVISAGQHLALVMAYVPGCDLEELLQQAPLPLLAILNLGIDIGAALAAVRQRRLVHGDLKASNVLVAEDGHALLTDFGIARAPGSRMAAGSAAAVSPEQLRGEPLDVRSDLFALGCLLYRMIAGRHPFLDGEELDARRLLEGAPSALPDKLADGTPVPGQLRDLVDRLLQKKPGDRPDNTHRVRQILRELARQQPQAMARHPLAGVRSALRRESEDDVPPAIPRALGRQGRSQLADWRGFSELSLRDALVLLRRPRVRLAVLGAALIAALAVYLLSPVPQRVALEGPRLAFDQPLNLPEGVSLDWLSERVCTAAAGENRHLRFYQAPKACPQGSAGIADNRPLPPADERLGMVLRCAGEVCLFGLTRARGEARLYRQAVLLAGMPLSQWSAVVSDLSRHVYRQDLDGGAHRE
nr:serine/threonine-protein kinase [Parahaliea mediterranea]